MMHKVTRILLLEGEASLRGALQSLFRKLNPEVQIVVAESGESALRLLENPSPFGLVVSEVLLTGQITGVDLWRMSRQRWPGMEFAFISELPDAFFRGLIEDGETPPLYLEKPLSRSKLEELVRRAA